MSERHPDLPGVKFLERPNFTETQVNDVIARALVIADEHVERGPEWASVFKEACRMLSNKQILQVQNAPLGMALDPAMLGKRH